MQRSQVGTGRTARKADEEMSLPIVQGTCGYCLQSFERGSCVVPRYCSATCARREENRRRRAGADWDRSSRCCAECGESYVPEKWNQRYCSAGCKRRRERRDCPSWSRWKRRSYEQLRDRRIRAGLKQERVELPVVAERDGWCCHLCGGAVTRRDWSMDHLVPISAGGEHTYANVALAHQTCNSRRGARPLVKGVGRAH